MAICISKMSPDRPSGVCLRLCDDSGDCEAGVKCVALGAIQDTSPSTQCGVEGVKVCFGSQGGG